jgi:hypothetical protein
VFTGLLAFSSTYVSLQTTSYEQTLQQLIRSPWIGRNRCIDRREASSTGLLHVKLILKKVESSSLKQHDVAAEPNKLGASKKLEEFWNTARMFQN